MKKNIAVIGCGHWGKNLVRNFSEIGALGAVCDPNVELAESYANECKVKNLTFDEILNNPDLKGIVIAAPAPLHASMGIDAMNAGKHVYIEKPLAMNKTEAKEMSCYEKDKSQFFLGHPVQKLNLYCQLFRLIKIRGLSSQV